MKREVPNCISSRADYSSFECRLLSCSTAAGSVERVVVHSNARHDKSEASKRVTFDFPPFSSSLICERAYLRDWLLVSMRLVRARACKKEKEREREKYKGTSLAEGGERPSSLESLSSTLSFSGKGRSSLRSPFAFSRV